VNKAEQAEWDALNERFGEIYAHLRALVSREDEDSQRAFWRGIRAMARITQRMTHLMWGD